MEKWTQVYAQLGKLASGLQDGSKAKSLEDFKKRA
jgi:hypothetical protein